MLSNRGDAASIGENYTDVINRHGNEVPEESLYEELA
jgi:hypothetical protein